MFTHRYGLNIDGADFSELIKQYEENAIVGGVAAATMLVLVGGACLLWNCRYANRHFPDDEGDVIEEQKSHSNAGFRSDMEMTSDVTVVTHDTDQTAKS